MSTDSASSPETLADAERARAFFDLPAAEGIPASTRLRRRVLEGRAQGLLSPGLRLPPVRTLAQWLDLAPNTVAKAYRELEAVGAAEGRGRAGTFLRGEQAEEHRAMEAARRYLKTLEELGYGPQEAVALVERVCEELSENPVKHSETR